MAATVGRTYPRRLWRAIQTHYGGYRFRSRLEARWAVFFDQLNLPWHYEQEGYELPSGRYLPDFWLPSVTLRANATPGIWLEVKAAISPPEEHTRLAELSRATGQPAILCVGLPDHDDPGYDGGYQFVAQAGIDDEESADCWWDNGIIWCRCEQCGHIGVDFEGRYFVCPHGHAGPYEYGGNHWRRSGLRSTLAVACDMARAARFEYGDRGAPASVV